MSVTRRFLTTAAQFGDTKALRDDSRRAGATFFHLRTRSARLAPVVITKKRAPRNVLIQ